MDGQVDVKRLQAGFWVGDWFVEPLLNRASSNGEAVPVEPKVMDVLLCLARHAGKTVTKDHFMEQVWTGAVVTEDVLSRCISELRKVFGDDSRDPRFIETIRKTGYRLIAPVALPDADSDGILQTEDVAFVTRGGVRHPFSFSTLWRLFWRKSTVWIRRHLYRPLFRGTVAGVLLVLLGGSFWYWRTKTLDTVGPPTTVPFTSYLGQEIEPALSPDGHQVAFAWDNNTGRDFDIYIKQVGAEPPLRITDERANEHSPAWSPDGLHLGFVRSERDRHAVFVVPTIGGRARKVADFETRAVRGVAWSPDGRTLAVSAQQASYAAFSLFLVTLDSARVQPLTSPPAHYQGDLRPAFSPDGKHLAFVRSLDEGLQDLYVVEAEGGEPKQLTFDAAGIAGLDWTADGKDIVFTSQRGGASGLWRISASGGDPEWIVMAGEGMHFQDLSVARQGSRLAYVQRSSNTNIWRLWQPPDIQRYRAHLLLSSTRWESNPQISPDGNRIAFASNQSGTFEIWTCDRSGEDPIQLTSFGGAPASNPRWSPDGAFISFVAYQEGQADLYVVDAEGGTPRRLTTSSADDRAPSWSRDGRLVYFASSRSGTWEIWKIPVEGGEAMQVTTTGGWAAFESSDGRLLYYVKPHARGIWQRSTLPGGEDQERLLVASLKPTDWGNWAVGTDGIYFIRRDAYGPVLAFYHIETEQITQIAPLSNAPEPLSKVPEQPSLAVAPDATWFLYTQVDRNESDILLVEHFR